METVWKRYSEVTEGEYLKPKSGIWRDRRTAERSDSEFVRVVRIERGDGHTLILTEDGGMYRNPSSGKALTHA